jgi:hypothetical protein
MTVKGLAFVTVSLVAVAGVSLILVLSPGQDPLLPVEARALFERYAEEEAGAVALKTAAHAGRYEAFEAGMAAPLVQLTQYATRPSPGLYGGEVIQVTADTLTYPPDDVWCLFVETSADDAAVLFVTRHEQLYLDRWALHEQAGSDPDAQLAAVGCQRPQSAGD